MMNFNKAIVAGNLTRDPEIRSMQNGQQVANLGIASNRYYNDQQGNRQEKTEFHNIVAFGKLADICAKYLKKGTLVLVEGRLQTSNWEGKDGVKRYKTEIIMESMQMGPRRDGSGAERQSQSQERPEQSPISQDEIPVIEAEEMIIEDQGPEKEKVDVKDIPF
ncbi:single-stranded DNA-binding protein [Patescibacteria group bacterium]|nr:single-stranded DNA-binding protein [Patescibacteria group bacterium]